MALKNQKVEYGVDGENFGKFLGQEVTSVVVDEEGYAFGYWKGKLVGSFSLNNGTWYVM